MNLVDLFSPPRRFTFPQAFFLAPFFALVFGLAPLASAADERPFVEGKFEKAELRYVNSLPVLIVDGAPEEMGRQKAVLTAEVTKKLRGYPHKLAELVTRTPERLEKFHANAFALVENIPERYRREMRAFMDQANVEGAWQDGVLGNVMMDAYRGSFSCSSLMVEADRSATGGPLFGRNLDFYTQGVLDPYSLVTVHRPEGRRAFAMIGFPGLFGCLSGMNDAGLAVCVHEVFVSKDNAPIFNPKGTPYIFLFRRILEECATIEEAEKLLRESPRTTMLNLAVCDPKSMAVLEMTPKTVAVRKPDDGILVCTNHFRSPELVALPWCDRYKKLIAASGMKKIDVSDVAQKLDEANMGSLTVQTMVFEPASLVVNLAIGSCPSSKLPAKRLELAPLFKAK